MGKFVVSPDVLRIKGMEFLNHAENFDMKVAQTYQSVSKIVTSDYVSPEAAAIGRDIEKYRGDLIQMTKMLTAYGNFCLNSSKKVVVNQDNIISGI